MGDAGNTQYDRGDLLLTFNSFRNAAKPIPYEATLRHYNTVNSDVPLSVDMDPEVFERMCSAFTCARYVLFLIDVVPGTESVRLERQDKISRLVMKIHGKRAEFESNPSALMSSLVELNAMRDMLMLRLQRQELIMEVRAIAYEDMKKYEKCFIFIEIN